MFRATLGLLVAGILWVSAPTSSVAETVCGERTDIFGQLESRHGETPQAIGITGDGKLIEVLVSPTGGWSLALLSLYGVLFLRIAARMLDRGYPVSKAVLYGMFCILGKLPQLLGQTRFLLGRLTNRRSPLIEYKGARS